MADHCVTRYATYCSQQPSFSIAHLEDSRRALPQTPSTVHRPISRIIPTSHTVLPRPHDAAQASLNDTPRWSPCQEVSAWSVTSATSSLRPSSCTSPAPISMPAAPRLCREVEACVWDARKAAADACKATTSRFSPRHFDIRLQGTGRSLILCPLLHTLIELAKG